ncbi:MAG TPA: hypothetical protein VK817_04460 [Trebonia sp.]|jgi:hypothetical protein|nr:hypothetical protein [Trebonia sp.]
MDEGSSEPDILEHKGRLRLPRLPSPGWRPTRAASILAAVTLAIGLAAGYVAGHGQGPGTAAPPGKPAAAAPLVPIDFGPALSEEQGTCSVQAGRDLQLGIPVTNQSPETVLLKSVKPVPLVPGLLRVLSWRWDPCGFDNDGISPDTVALGPGETTWVTAVVQPLVACPGPAPLQFRVTYSINSQQTSFNLPGFPDLSAVHYSGCPAPAA